LGGFSTTVLGTWALRSWPLVQNKTSLATRTSFARARGGAQLHRGRCADSSVVIAVHRLLNAKSRASPAPLEKIGINNGVFSLQPTNSVDKTLCTTRRNTSRAHGEIRQVPELQKQINRRPKSNDVCDHIVSLSEVVETSQIVPSAIRVLYWLRAFSQFDYRNSNFVGSSGASVTLC
jgi:hypothetical protein